MPRSAPPERVFVEIAQKPSLGVEVTTGRAWVGVDQQVGHGSADALFALTDEQYAAALLDPSPIWQLMAECWRGEHPELLLFHPGGGAWRPARWHPARSRVIPPRVAGEIWKHVDALGGAPEAVAVSQALAAGTARVGADSIAFDLTGERAYPRPGALIAGLTAGADRRSVSAVLGDADTCSLEGDVLRLGYVDGGLDTIALDRGPLLPPPAGPLGTILAALGQPEEGPAFQEVVRLVGGGPRRRWAVSSGFTRRLIAFDGGGELQVDDGRVLSVRLPWRGDLGLGAAAATSIGYDLYRFAEGDLVDEHGTVTAVLHGVSVSHRIHRWRSGEFTLFLDALGREASHPLVAAIERRDGTRVQLERGVVTAIEIGRRGHQAERFAAFIDGMPAEPVRSDLALARPSFSGEHDDVRYFEQGWIHSHASDGTHVDWIVVSRDEPRV